MAKNLSKHQRRLIAPRFSDDPIRTTFLRQHRGSLGLRMPNGAVRWFRDAAHRSACLASISAGRYESPADLTDAIRAAPNGYSAFLDLGPDDRATRLR